MFDREEIWKGCLSDNDVIPSDDVWNKVIAGYFKEVKIKELWIWKGNMRSLTGMVSHDGHLLSGNKPRKNIFWRSQYQG